MGIKQDAQTVRLIKEVEKKALEHESKHSMSVRVVVERTRKALKAIEIIGTCTGCAYELTPDEKASVVKVLVESVKYVSSNFANVSLTDDDFVLP